MQIRRILLRNLHSIRSEVAIDFMASPLVDSGLFAITGDTGAGKTTILDAITLAMYGKVCRNSKPEEVLSHGAEEGFAECDFEANGRVVRCQWRCWQPRSKKGAGPKTERYVSEWSEEKQDFLIVAERKLREIDAFVEEVSGLDFERFTRSAMLAQGDFAAFLKAAPKERSELLERITGTEVYSEIGKAAFERNKLEQSKLEALTTKRDALQVFSKEEMAQRKADLKAKEAAAKATKTELDTAKNALQWLRQVTQLETAKAATALDLEAMELEKKALQTPIQRLAQHQKTLPLHPTLARLDDKLAESVSLDSTAAQLAQNQSGEEAAASSLRLVFEEKTVELDALKAGQPAALRLFDVVGQMDGSLAVLSENLAKTIGEKTATEQRRQTIAAQITELEAKSAAHQNALTELDNWLKTNEVWASLPQDLSAVNVYEEQLRENLRGKSRLQKEAEALLQKLAEARQEATRLDTIFTQEKNTLGELLAAFENTAPDDFTPDRQDLLEKLSRELESLGERHKNFRQLGSLNADYRAALTEHASLEQRLDDLRRAELEHDKSLLSAYEEAEEWEQQLAYRRAVYTQQLLLANYEKDRANLQEGDPCPLCLSVHHPFRLHEVRPFVDEARNDLQAAENAQRERHLQRSILLKKHIEVNTQIQQIEGVGTGDMAKLEGRIAGLEQRLAALLPGMGSEEFSRSTGTWLVDKLDNFEAELAEKKRVREQLTVLNGQITVKEKLVQQLENQLKDLRFAEQQHEAGHADRLVLLKDLKLRFDEATTELDKLLVKYDYRFSLDTAKQMFLELGAKAVEFVDKRTGRDDHERQLGLAQLALKQAKETFADLEVKCQSLDAQIGKAKLEFDGLQAKRAAAFGDKNPVAEREKLLHGLEISEQGHAAARAGFEAAKEQLAQTRQRLEGTQIQLAAAKKSILELEASLKTGLAKAGFESLAALRSAILPTQEAERIAAQAEQIKLREVATTQAAKSAKEALEAALAKPLTTEPAPEIEAKAARLEAEMQEAQQQIGALNQQLKDNEARKTEGEIILQQIDNQRVEANRWAAMNDLIGSHDGVKFRKFAQGLTLQKLVQLANVHLENLYGRYFVRKRPSEDLELDIVDTYQADNVRSMMTLSGGESFLVSLSLALGLSDLAGRNANIRSLFIDEGFGTLDDQTLDMAICTLENLQAKGKTIGIISHVKELKERIATQVRVLKKGGGTSEVEVV